MKRRKRTKKEMRLAEEYRGKPRHSLPCSSCGRILRDRDPLVKSVKCSYCVVFMNPWWETEEDKEERPRGWHRRKLYISPSGQAYSLGKEITDEERRRISKAISKSSKAKSKRKKRKSKKKVE